MSHQSAIQMHSYPDSYEVHMKLAEIQDEINALVCLVADDSSTPEDVSISEDKLMEKITCLVKKVFVPDM